MTPNLTTVDTESVWAQINLYGPGSVPMQRDGAFRMPAATAQNSFRRGIFLRKYGYAVPRPAAIEAILEFLAGDSVLEIGAGRALWARLLKDAGAQVEATDKWTPTQSGYDVFKESDDTWTHVRQVDGRLAAELTCHGCLMTIWPPYGYSMAVDALRVFRGDKVIYIGEQNGCTANDDFHRMLDKEWEELATVAIPQWYGINDAVYFYVRKNQ